MADRFLLHVTVDIDPQKESEWNEWYNHIHIPAILRCPGFLNARRYRTIRPNGPRYVAIYEMENPAALESDEFGRARGWFKFSPFVIKPRIVLYQEIFRSAKEGRDEVKGRG